jgi:hypothetical protein
MHAFWGLWCKQKFKIGIGVDAPFGRDVSRDKYAVIAIITTGSPFLVKFRCQKQLSCLEYHALAKLDTRLFHIVLLLYFWGAT